MPESRPVTVKLWGEIGCFTRPELKVERVSYPVMTPSAARGALEAILWKPQFRWMVERVTVLAPIRYIAFRRNEVQKKLSVADVTRWMVDITAFEPLYADSRGRADGEVATQRNTVALRDVAYLIQARAVVDEPTARTDPPEKYAAMFERRVEKGQAYHRPYLGCREFAAHFAPPDGSERPLEESIDLGLMLYDIVFAGSGNLPIFFPARLQRGVLDCHPDAAIPDAVIRERLLTC